MKDNKIIAEFMELETETFSSGIVNYYHQDIAEGSFFEEHELSYNLSWDWLMPVVKKIESYNVNVNINGLYSVFNKNVAHQVTIRIEAVEMSEGGKSAWVLEDEYLYHSDVKDSKIEAVYQAVVEFIRNRKLYISKFNYSLVLGAILKRCGSLDNLICELREDADVVYVNIADDIDDVLNEYEIEEIINKIIT
tara:strand:+ start:2556 stop:3134 length:579 start_codon:yes stop_codon:yes gene_type:complete